MSKPKKPKPSGGPPRDERGRILPGHSLNPGGVKDTGEVKALARKHTADAIDALAKIVRRGKSEAARVMAAEAILNRGWGKPTQAVELDAKGDLASLLGSILKEAAEEERPHADGA